MGQWNTYLGIALVLTTNSRPATAAEMGAAPAEELRLIKATGSPCLFWSRSELDRSEPLPP